MGEERITAALARLENALARVEAAASRPMAGHYPGEDEAIRLRTRHEALRGKVEGAIARIDALLGAEKN